MRSIIQLAACGFATGGYMSTVLIPAGTAKLDGESAAADDVAGFRVGGFLFHGQIEGLNACHDLTP